MNDSRRAPIVVLSGGPCSGKTSLIRELARRGHPTLPEAAEEIIRDPELGALRQADPLGFQRAIFERQLDNEARLLRSMQKGTGEPPKQVTVFADRGIGDHFGYLAYGGRPPFRELVEAWSKTASVYRSVLWCELHPEFTGADHRTENEAEARELHEVLRSEYERRDLQLIDVPWLPLVERLELVLRLAEDPSE